MLKRDCYWYYCEHEMGASIDCCTLMNELGNCPCSDNYHNYVSNKEVTELLKAQEPVKPVFERQFMSNIELYDCGKCGTSLGAKGIAKYCMACGQAVKWE